MLANGDRPASIFPYLGVAIAFLAILSCLLNEFGAIFFADTASILDFIGPLALIAMLPAVVFHPLPARIAFWLLAATFLAWQIRAWPHRSPDWMLNPWTVVMLGSMWFLFLLLVWRAIRELRNPQPGAMIRD